MFSLIHGVIVKAVLPASLFGKIHVNEEPMSLEQKSHSITAIARKPSMRKNLSGSKKVEDRVVTAIN